MMLGSRNGFAVGGWRNPYVTNGLIAMWDGEWNEGGETHNANNLRLVELCGSGNDLIIDPTYGTLGLNFVHCNGLGVAAAGISELQSFSTQQIEVVFSITGRPFGGNNFIIDLYRGPARLGGADYFRKFSIYARYNSAIGFSSLRGINASPNISTTIRAYSISCDASLGDTVFIDGIWTNGIGPSSPATLNGAANTNIYPTLGYSAEGDIYTIRVYSRKLTASEIAANYAVDKARFNLP